MAGAWDAGLEQYDQSAGSRPPLRLEGNHGELSYLHELRAESNGLEALFEYEKREMRRDSEWH